MSVRITFRSAAQRQVAGADAWWRSNRPAAPGLFSSELDDAIAQLTELPESGPLLKVQRGRWSDVRTLVLSRTEYLLFYRIVGKEHVRVLALRHGRRKPA